MENPVGSDIFKFMALRSPTNYDHERDLIGFIRDIRIQDTYLPAETHDIDKDESDKKFSNSQVAGFVFARLKSYLPNISSNKDLLSNNRAIAGDVAAQFTVNERTERPWIDDFVLAVENHLADFSKPRLVEELNGIARKHFPKYSGISDYVEIAVQGNSSQFCIDFDYLFDRLYTLYVCKRIYPVNLEYVMNGLRALHLIRFLNIELAHARQQRQGCLFTLLTFLRRFTARQPGLAEGSSTSRPAETETRARTRCAEMKLTDNGRIPVPAVAIDTREQLARVYGASPCVHKVFGYLLGYYKPFNDIRPIGIGDLLVVKQFLCKYEAGEIAHVENVLKGESKERSHRRLDRVEDTYSLEKEKTEETQKELQTTSRFELQTEAAATIQSDLNAQVSASVSGTYGAVTFSASGGLAYSESKSESQRNASNFSKEILDRSLSRVQARAREERTTKKIFEIEEINKHGFNNVGGSGNISGIYRWLDKHYKAQVYNYGKRLMFEFVIPEPAKFVKAVVELEKRKISGPGDPPRKPNKPSLTIGFIAQADVDQWANELSIDVSGLDPRPDDAHPMNFACNNDAAKQSPTRDFSADVPKGYEVSTAHVVGGSRGNKNSTMHIAIGGVEQGVKTGANQAFATFDPTDFAWLTPVQDKLAVAVRTVDIDNYSFTVTAEANITDEYKMEWQNQAFGLLMNGYNQRLNEWNGLMADYAGKQAGYDDSQEVAARGRNPKINEEIIRTELKKHCITMITKQFATDRANDIDFNAMKARSEAAVTGKNQDGTPRTETIPVPAIDIDDAREKGRLVQFLEQAFEWPQISYLLYPYFWGQFTDWWFETQQYYDEPDPLYAKFLQAGSARVLIAVSPAYETAVMHYLFTQEPWNGGEAPSINDSMYKPIYAELRNQQDDLHGAEPYGDPWKVVVPTSLVYLQGSYELPTYDCGVSGKNP